MWAPTRNLLPRYAKTVQVMAAKLPAAVNGAQRVLVCCPKILFLGLAARGLPHLLILA